MSQKLKELAERKGMFDRAERDWNRGMEAPPEGKQENIKPLSLKEFEKQWKKL
jgi:hypothetical protein